MNDLKDKKRFKRREVIDVDEFRKKTTESIIIFR